MIKQIFTKSILISCFSFLCSFSFAQDKINVILFGTYHFNNPGNDAAKTVEKNILLLKNQKGLDQISTAIASMYRPDQIFVESDFYKKDELNQHYQLYLKNQFKKYTDTIKNNRLKRFYVEGETYQLAFRLAKLTESQELYPIDSLIEMRFDILQKEVNANVELKKKYDSKLTTLSAMTNNCLQEEQLEDVFKCLNDKQMLNENKGFYISFINKLNTKGHYFGATLNADWYKRNLVMYANIQNQLKPNTNNIFILVGTGHAAMLKEFFESDENFKLIDLTQIL